MELWPFLLQAAYPHARDSNLHAQPAKAQRIEGRSGPAAARASGVSPPHSFRGLDGTGLFFAGTLSVPRP